MKSPLDTLIGLWVTKVVKIEGYVQLHFGNEVGLTIYNKISLEPLTADAKELVGNMVTSVRSGMDAIEIRFLAGPQLRIHMRPEAYQGPEAMELNRKDLPAVIWN
jgi:hypothetical protein